MKTCSSHAKIMSSHVYTSALPAAGACLHPPGCLLRFETSRLRLLYCVYDAGPNGERYCWYQATVKGGREGRPIDAVKLARVCQDLGAGEIMLNCVDMDGQVRGRQQEGEGKEEKWYGQDGGEAGWQCERHMCV